MGRRSNRSHRDQNRHVDDDLFSETYKARPSPSPTIVNRAPVRPKGADLRRWDPRPDLARDATGRPARIVHKVAARVPKQASRNAPRPRSDHWLPTVRSPASFRFESAGKINICVRRKMRREVLHALQKTSAGKGSPKKRNQWSEIKC